MTRVSQQELNLLQFAARSLTFRRASGKHCGQIFLERPVCDGCFIVPYFALMAVEIVDFPKTIVAATESLAHLIGKNGGEVVVFRFAIVSGPLGDSQRRRTLNDAA
jgi:hypothetical protein